MTRITLLNARLNETTTCEVCDSDILSGTDCFEFPIGGGYAHVCKGCGNAHIADGAAVSI